MKNCTQCKSTFQVTEQDKKYYKRIDAPDPDLCPQCRQNRRASWRNEWELYHRKCDLTGKQIVSIYSPDKPFPVYSQKAFWGDDWDALDFGRDFDFSRPFFDQFSELINVTPRLAIVNKQAENSDYCNFSCNNKNCYLTFGCHYEEDCYYGRYSTKNQNCLDYFWLYGSELCYECSYSRRCYKSVYLDHCEDCNECYFSVDLKSCKHCIFSSSLRNKEYYILNEPHTKEEYFKKLEQFSFHGYKRFKEAKTFFMNDFRKRFPFRDVYQVNCENCEGGSHENSKNLIYSFDCTDCEDCSYGFQMDQTYNSMDTMCMGYDKCEWCYEAIGINGGFNILCSESSWHCADIMYCSLCFECKNCFGCVGLKHKTYCIFNKQYSKKDYEEIVGKIISHMKEGNEYGQFFPIEISPFAYNETVAINDFPLTRDQALLNNWKWKDDDDMQSYKGPLYEIPDTIQDVDDDILKKILVCEVTKKPYKVIPQELKFYRELGVPVPHLSPNQRHFDRIQLRNPHILHDRKCDKCKKDIKAHYSSDRPEQVYCEECYLKEVY